MNREREIVKASIYGIIGNALLVAFKMAVGFMSHSIAIILDGVNNATDALSSIVTIVGTKLAGRRPDRRHPFGYGRVEYLTSVVIAIIILVAGFISLRESIDKIIHPGTPSYSAITITVIVVGDPREDRHRHHVQALRRQNELRGPHRLGHRFQL